MTMRTADTLDDAPDTIQSAPDADSLKGRLIYGKTSISTSTLDASIMAIHTIVNAIHHVNTPIQVGSSSQPESPGNDTREPLNSQILRTTLNAVKYITT